MDKNRYATLAKLLMDGALMTALLILVIAGARLYGQVLTAKTLCTQKRLPLSFIQSQAAGAEGSIRVEPGPAGDMLCMGQGEFETRIYVLDGQLRTEFSPVGTPLSPEDSQSICAVEEFILTRQPGSIEVRVNGCLGYFCTGGIGDE